jgi:hypothetical protein
MGTPAATRTNSAPKMNDDATKAFAVKIGKRGPEYRTEFLPPE